MSDSELNKKLNRLQNYSKKLRVLTVYLSYDEKKTPSASKLRSEFSSLLTTCLTDEYKKEFRNQIEKIFTYLEDAYDSRNSRSVVFFAGEGVFEILEFEFALSSLCHVADAPYLSPLDNALSEHNTYMVLMVDRKKARFFTVSLGEIQEHKDLVVDMVPQNVKTNEEKFYGRENKIFRHIDDHLNRHLKIVAEHVEDFVRGRRVKFIILGGHEEMFKKTLNHLPKRLRDKVRAEFISELNVPINDIFLASKKVVRELESRKEYRKMNIGIMQAG